jgi:hypothetical protein
MPVTNRERPVVAPVVVVSAITFVLLLIIKLNLQISPEVFDVPKRLHIPTTETLVPYDFDTSHWAIHGT